MRVSLAEDRRQALGPVVLATLTYMTLSYTR